LLGKTGYGAGWFWIVSQVAADVGYEKRPWLARAWNWCVMCIGYLEVKRLNEDYLSQRFCNIACQSIPFDVKNPLEILLIFKAAECFHLTHMGGFSLKEVL
jgi:hypothetical protein